MTAVQHVRPRRAHGGTPWPEARRLAAGAATLAPRRVALAEAAGRVLAEDVVSLVDLPVADVSAMDGWAVAGLPPWQVVAALAADATGMRSLAPGECAEIATGAALPPGADRVLPVEHGSRAGGQVRPEPEWDALSRHVRAVGEEARRGDVLVPAGRRVTPPVVGVAAAAGHDSLLVRPAARLALLVLGDEIVAAGRPAPGRTRDALGPQLPAWADAWGASCLPPRHVPDGLEALVSAVGEVDADVVVTTGGTSVGRHDHLHDALRRVGAQLVVDGVDVKPGHPMLLATLPDGRWLAGLPGNPLAACVALVTLVQPLLAALHGVVAAPAASRVLDVDQPARAGDGHRLVPVTSVGTTGQVLDACGPAMLRGLAAADGFVVVPPTGARAGDELEYLPLP